MRDCYVDGMNAPGRALLIATIVAATFLSGGSVSAERSVAAELPRGYVGDFKWDDSSVLQRVVFKFSTVAALDDNSLEARGCGLYEVGGQVTNIRVRMMVQLPALAVTISELDPIDDDDFVTDGRHEGHLSDDLQAIDAIWTTRETGEHGRLRLRAAPAVECEPLHESSATTSTVPIAALPGTTPTAHQQRRRSP